MTTEVWKHTTTHCCFSREKNNPVIHITKSGKKNIIGSSIAYYWALPKTAGLRVLVGAAADEVRAA
jgi:hypothetical protein